MQITLPAIEPTAIRLPIHTAELNGLEIALTPEPRGLVLLLCAAGRLEIDAGGTMNALAEHGYATIAIDVAARGQGDAVLVENLCAAVNHALGAGWEPDQIGMVGYRLGGRAVLLGAMDLELGAAVSISPTDPASINLSYPGVRTPWLGIFAHRDPSTSPAQVRALHNHLHNVSNAYISVVSYDAGAEFFRDPADPAVHSAAFDGWQRTVEWLDLRVAPPPTPLALAWRDKAGPHAQQTGPQAQRRGRSQ